MRIFKKEFNREETPKVCKTDLNLCTSWNNGAVSLCWFLSCLKNLSKPQNFESCKYEANVLPPLQRVLLNGTEEKGFRALINPIIEV